MDHLRDILIQELEKYTGEGANAITLPIFDDVHQHYAVAILDIPTRREPSDLLLFARLHDGKIVIEEDMTDKKLVDALVQQGVPRQQIILAYDGEVA